MACAREGFADDQAMIIDRLNFLALCDMGSCLVRFNDF